MAAPRATTAAEGLFALDAGGVPKDGEAALLVARLLGAGAGGKIRCPGCKWEPDKSSRWCCEPACGEVWNTFDTQGECPRCARQWAHTQCLSCHGWFLHENWYEGPSGTTSP